MFKYDSLMYIEKMKRVFIVHGWGGYPNEGWFPWLKGELEKHGFQVEVPELPDTDNPRINNWVPALKSHVVKADEETYFVGHSMGNQAIARYLESLPDGVKVGGAIFVAGFFKNLTNIEEDEIDIANDWLQMPIDLEKVKSHLNKSVAIFSDDDPFVPLDNQDDFRDKLGSEIIIEHGKKHYSGSDGIKEIPIVLSSILKILRT